jgi:hypothetical protein
LLEKILVKLEIVWVVRMIRCLRERVLARTAKRKIAISVVNFITLGKDKSYGKKLLDLGSAEGFHED